MKKLFSFLLVGLLAVSCNNDKTTETTTTQSSPGATGTDNVEGNIPDSTGGINLNQPMPQDSSGLNDSLPR
jgi:hypothetical protein